MHKLATVFDPRVKLRGMLILPDAYNKNMLHDPVPTKAEVTQLLYDIYALYNES